MTALQLFAFFSHKFIKFLLRLSLLKMPIWGICGVYVGYTWGICGVYVYFGIKCSASLRYGQDATFSFYYFFPF